MAKLKLALALEQQPTPKHYHVEIFDGKTGVFKGVLSAGKQQKTVFCHRTAQKHAAEMTAKDTGNFYQVIYKNDGSQNLNLYRAIFTDTFSGEANYCWVHRFCVWAPNIKQAITRAKQQRYRSPLPKHTTAHSDSDSARIDINGANVCAFVDWLDADEHNTRDHGEISNGSE